MNPQASKKLRREQRQPFNEVCGILLLCSVFMLAAVLLTVLVQAGFTLLISGIRNGGMDMDDILRTITTSLQENGVGYLLYAVACLVVILVWKGKAFYKTAFHSYRPMGFSVFFQLLCVFFSLQMAGSLISGYLEGILNLWGLSTYSFLEEVTGGSKTVSMFLYVSVFAPIVEELLFRGAILRTFQPYGKRFAIVFSALLFGLFHMNLVQTPFAFFLGLILGYVAVEYSLTWSIVFHFINNCIMAELLSDYTNLQSVLMFLFVIAALIILTIHGNDIKAYHRSLNPMPREAIRSFWTAPVTILFLLVCLASCLCCITVL